MITYETAINVSRGVDGSQEDAVKFWIIYLFFAAKFYEINYQIGIVRSKSIKFGFLIRFVTNLQFKIISL